jgi:hypothetical protein
MSHLLILHKVIMVIDTIVPIETEAAEEPVKLEFIQVVPVELEHRIQ